jgi:hypothetical protein
MTPEQDLAAVAARIVEQTRAEQGKPRHVEDPETLSRVALVLRAREGVLDGVG